MTPPVQPSPRVPKEALVRLVSTLAAVPTFWRTDQTAAIPGLGPGAERARIWLKLNTYAQVGTDELRTQYAPAPVDANVFVLVGQRQLTLSVRAESFGSLEAFDLCERVRFRLRTEVARAIFAPAHLSLRDVQPIAVFEQKADPGGRVMRVATMDIRWNLVVFADPDDPGEGGYVKTVDGGGIIPGTLLPPGQSGS